MLVDIRTELDFLHFDDLLLFARLIGPLLRLIFIFAIIEDFADRRFCIRLDLYKIEAKICSLFHRVTRIKHAELVSIRIDASYLWRPDCAIDTRAVLNGRHITVGTSYLTSPVFVCAHKTTCDTT